MANGHFVSVQLPWKPFGCWDVGFMVQGIGSQWSRVRGWLRTLLQVTVALLYTFFFPTDGFDGAKLCTHLHTWTHLEKQISTRKKNIPKTSLEKSFCVQLVRPPVFHQGGLG